MEHIDAALLESLRRENEELKTKLAELQKTNSNLVAITKAKEREIAKLKTAQLKTEERPTATSKRFKMVTVLFSSIRGFAKLSEQANAKELVDALDQYYYYFDNIVEKYHIKKIKSIGDTYMCAGGIPKKNRTNPYEIVLAALDIQQYIKNMRKNSDMENFWDISLGIHTGPVIANISGKKKVSYELKGDTVDVAHRIEASVENSEVIVSAMTYELIRDFFECEYVSKLPVKYTGDTVLYKVLGFKAHYQLDENKLKFNKDFSIRFQHIRFDDLEEYILNRLENELPKYLTYHNVKHTMDVTIGVEIIGQAEGVTLEEMLYLKTAGLFHDMGQIVQSKGHEEISCKFAREILPNYFYTQDQIDTICNIIMATQLPPTPQNLLQKIICDADLDYLGRSDFIPVSDTLYLELHTQNIIDNINDWNKLQVKFITGHQYFTRFAQNNREVNKQKQIERLKQLIDED